MTFTDIQTEVSEQAGLDISVASTATRVKRWINSIQQTISAFYDWSWLEERAVISTVTEITTGTITATTDSTSITFTNAPAVSVAGYFIQTSESNDWYKISAHTAASTAATLETAYTRTGGSGLAYTLRQVYYSLPSAVDRVIDIRQVVTPRRVGGILARRFDLIVPDMTSTGPPQSYYLFGQDSSKNWQIAFYPIPDQRLLIECRYYKKLSDLSSGSDTSYIPVKWHETLVQGALMKAAIFTGDTGILNDAKSNFRDLLSLMMDEDGQGRDENTTRRSNDVDDFEVPIPGLPQKYGRQYDG